MLLVVALGGNALSRTGDPASVTGTPARLARTGALLGELARHHRLVVTHGNGPQVGRLAEGHRDERLDVLDALSAGAIGYALLAALATAAPHVDAVAVLTRVVVDAADVARPPTKPIGAVVDERGRDLGEANGWHHIAVPGGWRRVVASPEPRAVVEQRALAALVALGLVVVADGGGGVPVARDAEGRTAGVQAVVDKDLSSALLAHDLGADALVLLTDVDGVHVDHGGPRQRTLRDVTCDELRALELPAGSMGPKADAACRFVDGGGAWAAIGALDDALRVVRGDAGTRVVASR